MSGYNYRQGVVPPGWSVPSPVFINGEYVDGGMVWMGKQEATQEDVAAVQESLGDTVPIDRSSLCGLWCWRWSSFYTRHTTGTPAGGVGSVTYENQLVGDSHGVSFAKEPIWYTNCDGVLVKGIPPEAGAYHEVYLGDDYYDLVEGVEPGSIADEIRGNGEFYWDDNRKLYDVR